MIQLPSFIRVWMFSVEVEFIVGGHFSKAENFRDVLLVLLESASVGLDKSMASYQLLCLIPEQG
ncbi:hypothetical protein [Pseudomonas sp. Ant30-3]|uniref:hypothetical protein n=1 Tax=Pseudomonas sp. Ant30-3 TaxID=1488328 RepID=UPI000490E244|nr:hypothetical protein [Pseudomonas sp. Ant30-3]